MRVLTTGRSGIRKSLSEPDHATHRFAGLLVGSHPQLHQVAHLRAINLIHEVGRNLPGPRGHNDSLAIRYEPSEIATDAGNDI